MLTIKKYSNRRLYNTETSKYINLKDIEELIKTNTEFRVIDAKTEADLTRMTLLQAIVEDEKGLGDLFPVELLKFFIYFKNSPFIEPFQDMLLNTFKTFLNMQGDFLGKLKAKEKAHWRYQDMFLNPFSFFKSSFSGSDQKSEPGSTKKK